MNLFGSSEAGSDGRLVRNVALAGGFVALIAVAAAAFLDNAAQNGSLASLGFLTGNDPARQMANVPRASEPRGGVRYGDVDYMPTASIPGSQKKIKNVVSDPKLGMPD